MTMFGDVLMDGNLPPEPDDEEPKTRLQELRAMFRREDDAGKDDDDLPVENDPWL